MKKLTIYILLAFVGWSCGTEKNPEPIQESFFGEGAGGNNNTTNFNPEDYNGIPSNRRTLLNADEFTVDMGNFVTNNTANWQTRIQEGYFYFRAIDNGVWRITSENFPIDMTKDFEIETAIQYSTANPNDSRYGLVWDENGGNNDYFDVYFTKASTVFWRKLIDNTIIEIEDLNTPFDADLIKSNTYNKITVRKVGSFYYFFINEKFALKKAFETFNGYRLGFTVGPTAEMRVDYIRTYVLN